LGATRRILVVEVQMLRISQKLEYAMRAMMELGLRFDGSEGRLVPAREIAETQQIPLRFLEQQLGTLHKAGLVDSFRGAGGGCRLARAPKEISIADVADAIEGPFYPVLCLEPEDHNCFQDSRCGLQDFWGDVRSSVREVFERTTVADLMGRHMKRSLETPFFAVGELARPN
jgi:Rrf2 family protein